MMVNGKKWLSMLTIVLLASTSSLRAQQTLSVGFEQDTLYACLLEPFTLLPQVTGGIPGYAYSWSTGDSVSQIDLLLERPDTLLIELTVGDQAGQEAVGRVWIIGLAECVYPGDANGDRRANTLDLLSVGRSFGSTGAERPNAHTNFIGQAAPPWNQAFGTGVNYVHSDADGDGRVSFQDVAVIRQNYVPNPEDPNARNSVEGGVPLFLDYPVNQASPGDTITIPVILGTESIPAQDVYGITFNINYDTAKVGPQGILASYNTSWLGTLNQDLAAIDYEHRAHGQLEVGITRVNFEEADGFGRIADITVMIEDIAGRVGPTSEFTLEISDVSLIRKAGQTVAVNLDIGPMGITLDREFPNTPETLVDAYPNPVHEVLTIKGQGRGLSYEVLNLVGKVVYQTDAPTPLVQVDVSDWMPGVYILRIRQRGKERSMHKRIIVH